MGTSSCGDGEEQRIEDEEQYGVLLYYKYTSVPNLDELVSFYESSCNSLGLLGRVRLSPKGVNVTVCFFSPSLRIQCCILNITLFGVLCLWASD